MTTIDAAAAKRFVQPIALAVIVAFAGFGLSGCESSSNLFGSATDPSPAVANQSAQPAQGQVAKMAVAPLLGPPDTVNKMFQSQLASAMESQKITVAKTPADKSEYTLRGYVVSANEKTRTKVSYIWDVTDAAGKQVHRVSGEETLPAPQGKDPWSSITPQVVESISAKTTASVAGWLGANAAPAAGGTPVASPATAPQPAQTAAAPSAQSPPAATAGVPTTGSIGREGGVNVVVANVTGAPGDGSVALTNAMYRALSSKGVALTDKATGQTYKVQGKVAVGQAKDGKQPIQIDWELIDPQGKFYKRVTQKNEIPQGMLDGAWGQTADAAAAAAADTIAGLIPKQQQAQAAAAKPN